MNNDSFNAPLQFFIAASNIMKTKNITFGETCNFR